MMLYDVTAGMHEGMPVYEGDPDVRITRVLSVADGAQANVSLYSFGSHTGTHVDPPLHVMDGGMPVDALPLDAMIGPALVVECPPGNIGRDHLESSGAGLVERLLLKSMHASGAAGPGAAYLNREAASYLAGLGVRLVGTEQASIENPASEALEVHRMLLSGGVVVLEGLDLSGVAPGVYELICLPLKIEGGDGAPARVVLRRN